MDKTNQKSQSLSGQPAKSPKKSNQTRNKSLKQRTCGVKHPQTVHKRAIATTKITNTHHHIDNSVRIHSVQSRPFTKKHVELYKNKTPTIDFSNHKKAYKTKTTPELLFTDGIFSLCRIPPLVTYAPFLIKGTRAIFGDKILEFGLRQTFYKHFCAGANEIEVIPTMTKIGSEGIGAILDYGAEPEDESLGGPATPTSGEHNNNDHTTPVQTQSHHQKQQQQQQQQQQHGHSHGGVPCGHNHGGGGDNNKHAVETTIDDHIKAHEDSHEVFNFVSTKAMPSEIIVGKEPVLNPNQSRRYQFKDEKIYDTEVKVFKRSIDATINTRKSIKQLLQDPIKLQQYSPEQIENFQKVLDEPAFIAIKITAMSSTKFLIRASQLINFHAYMWDVLTKRKSAALFYDKNPPKDDSSPTDLEFENNTPSFIDDQYDTMTRTEFSERVQHHYNLTPDDINELFDFCTTDRTKQTISRHDWQSNMNLHHLTSISNKLYQDRLPPKPINHQDLLFHYPDNIVGSGLELNDDNNNNNNNVDDGNSNNNNNKIEHNNGVFDPMAKLKKKTISTNSSLSSSSPSSPSSSRLVNELIDREDIDHLNRVMKRLDDVCKHAKEQGASIFVDAEQTYYQQAIDHMTMDLMASYNTPMPADFYRHVPQIENNNMKRKTDEQRSTASSAEKLTTTTNTTDATNHTDSTNKIPQNRLAAKKWHHDYDTSAMDTPTPIVPANWLSQSPTSEQSPSLTPSEIKHPVVWHTYQCYLKDTLYRIKRDFNLAQDHNFTFACKIVRGAYISAENERAAELGYTSPLNNNIDETHDSYNKALLYLLSQRNLNSSNPAHLLIASHNQQTFEIATSYLEEELALIDPTHINSEHNNNKITNHSPNAKTKPPIPRHKLRVYFAQLYGMGQRLTYPLAGKGYGAFNYLTYGPPIMCLPYLLRRAQENGSMLGGTAVESKLLRKEIWRRLFGGNSDKK
jgi:hypothetical protein